MVRVLCFFFSEFYLMFYYISNGYFHQNEVRMKPAHGNPLCLSFGDTTSVSARVYAFMHTHGTPVFGSSDLSHPAILIPTCPWPGWCQSVLCPLPSANTSLLDQKARIRVPLEVQIKFCCFFFPPVVSVLVLVFLICSLMLF